MSAPTIFMTPERVICGEGAAVQVGEHTKSFGVKKVFVVTDNTVAGLESFKRILQSLAEQGIEAYVYDEVDVNPSDVQVERGAALYKEQGAEALVAVGGGSPLDSAKAIGILAMNGGAIFDYHYDVDSDWTNPEEIPLTRPIPPLITIPTTSGTGAEVTAYAVITNTKDNYKMFPGSWLSLPKIALVDPLMSASMPPKVTAATGMDALSHAIEAYLSPYAMNQTDIFSLSAITLIVENLKIAVEVGDNLTARGAMALASTQAGLCMNAWCGGVHALGHQLSSQYGIPHGVAMAIMMPVVMEFNTEACVDRMAMIAKVMGENVDRLEAVEAAKKAPDAVRKLSASIGLPVSLSECNANPKKIADCAKWAVRDIDMDGNPRPISLADAEALYRKAF